MFTSPGLVRPGPVSGATVAELGLATPELAERFREVALHRIDLAGAHLPGRLPHAKMGLAFGELCEHGADLDLERRQLLVAHRAPLQCSGIRDDRAAARLARTAATVAAVTARGATR